MTMDDILMKKLVFLKFLGERGREKGYGVVQIVAELKKNKFNEF